MCPSIVLYRILLNLDYGMHFYIMRYLNHVDSQGVKFSLDNMQSNEQLLYNKEENAQNNYTIVNIINLSALYCSKKVICHFSMQQSVYIPQSGHQLATSIEQ